MNKILTGKAIAVGSASFGLGTGIVVPTVSAVSAERQVKELKENEDKLIKRIDEQQELVLFVTNKEAKILSEANDNKILAEQKVNTVRRGVVNRMKRLLTEVIGTSNRATKDKLVRDALNDLSKL